MGSTAVVAARPPTPPIRNSASTGNGPCRRSTSDPEQADGAERDHRVADVGIGERGREQPPPLRPRLADDHEVALGAQARAPQQAADQAGEHEEDGGVGPRLGGDRDLVPAQAGEQGRRLAAGLALGDALVAIELGSALTQAVSAVRALRDVGADLRSAALADHEGLVRRCSRSDCRTGSHVADALSRDRGPAVSRQTCVAATISAITSRRSWLAS